MLLIHCPYCEEERPELEFRGAGEAHIARPTNMADLTDEEFVTYLNDDPRQVKDYQRYGTTYLLGVSYKF